MSRFFVILVFLSSILQTSLYNNTFFYFCSGFLLLCFAMSENSRIFAPEIQHNTKILHYASIKSN